MPPARDPVISSKGICMVNYSTPPEALDDTFIRIFVDELTPSRPWPTGGAAGEEAGTAELSDDSSQAASPADPSARREEEKAGRPARASGRWRLRIIEEDGPEHLVPVGDKPITVGRSRDNLIIVRCPRVSRQHVRIWADEEGLHVKDLGVRKRMRVNGVKRSQARLRAEDVVQIGSVSIYVEHRDDNSGSGS